MSGEPGMLRLATRRSGLALAQSTAVGEQLAALTGRTLELVEVTTTGDVDRSSLAQIGGTGVFVAAVRTAVVDGHADVAVHSLKDLPTASDARLDLAAIPTREDPRDVLVTRSGGGLADLPPGARVGTGSPRRRAQLAAARPDLDIVDIRGNVDTRLARVLGGGDGARQPDLDAVVLAAAGLSRLGRREVITEYLDPAVCMPAPGQGALAVEVRAGSDLAEAVRTLDDPGTRSAVTAERTLLNALEAGCSAPVGALGHVADGGPTDPTVRLRAVLATVDGALLRRSTSGAAISSAAVGRGLAADLLRDLREHQTTDSPTTIDRGRPIR
jgi:hydroxymethylbilane synthase